MEIKLTKTIEETMDVELPIFFRNKTSNESKYMAVIDEKNVITFFESETYKSLTNCELWIKTGEVKEAYSKWQQIGETEFLDAHEAFIQSLSLTPKVI